MVSLKYETENIDDCISLVSGRNLCTTTTIMKSIIAFCILTIIGLLTHRLRQYPKRYALPYETYSLHELSDT